MSYVSPLTACNKDGVAVVIGDVRVEIVNGEVDKVELIILHPKLIETIRDIQEWIPVFKTMQLPLDLEEP